MNEVGNWIINNWFQCIQTFGIISGFLLGMVTALKATKARRISNYLLLTQYHRDIWKMTIDKPALNRIREMNIDLETCPITDEERQFVLFVLLHMTCAFVMENENEMLSIETMKQDINGFLQYPIPKKIWRNSKKFFNKKFVLFVDRKIKKPLRF